MRSWLRLGFSFFVLALSIFALWVSIRAYRESHANCVTVLREHNRDPKECW